LPWIQISWFCDNTPVSVTGRDYGADLVAAGARREERSSEQEAVRFDRRLPSGRSQARYPLADGQMRSAPQTFETKGEASRYLVTIEVDLLYGRYRDPWSGRIIFAEWVEMWLERTGKKRNSVARDRLALAIFMSDLGPRPLAGITRMHGQGSADARAKLAAPATVARDFSALRAVLTRRWTATSSGGPRARRPPFPASVPRAHDGLPRRAPTPGRRGATALQGGNPRRWRPRPPLGRGGGLAGRGRGLPAPNRDCGSRSRGDRLRGEDRV
jgi:hypothetical protein